MDKELEQDILIWLEELDPFTKGLFYEYCRRVNDYRGLDQFYNPVTDIPVESLCNPYFSYNYLISMVGIAGRLYNTFFRLKGSYEPLKSNIVAHDTGVPYFDSQQKSVCNVYSIPVKEIIELIDDKSEVSSKIGIWSDGTVAPVGFKDQPYYYPEKGRNTHEVMKELIIVFGREVSTAKEIARRISDRHQSEGRKSKGITHSDVSSAIQTINNSFCEKVNFEHKLIVNQSGITFNRKEIPLVLIS